MTKSTRAVLVSAFIFPGAGHVVLKRYAAAALFIVIALSTTLVILSHIVSIAVDVSDRIVRGELEPDILVIRGIIAEQQNDSQTILLNISVYLLVVIWIIATLDVYRVGKAQDKNKRGSEKEFRT